MGFFTDDEAASMRLARMSLHIVSGDEGFDPQPELDVEHDDFLLGLLKDIASDSVFQFTEISTTRSNIERIASRGVSFEEGAQALAADFCRLHKGNIRDGAFFVFEIRVDSNDVAIYGLVKYDYSEALEIVSRQGVTGLRRIVNAFISHRGAIQKSAFVRTRSGIADAAVSTRDRVGRPSPNLTDFFQSYLQVTRTRDDNELTVVAKDAVRSALSDNREYLPKGGLAACVSRANDILRSAEEINEDVLKQAVWVGAGQPADDETKSKLDNSVSRLIRSKKLTGVSFRPAASALPRAVKRTVMTAEGVRLEYNTALQGGAVTEELLEGGRTRFVVTTKGYTDDVNPDRVRSQT